MPGTKLQDLLELSYLDNLLRLYTYASGVPAAIIDSDGKVIAKSGWRQICNEFHKANIVTASRCDRKDEVEHWHNNRRYNISKCMNGLWEIRIPIVVDEQVAANFFFGQFFLLEEKPAREYFTEQADLFGFEKEKYIEAYNKIPVYPRELVDEMIDENLILVDLIEELADSNLKRRQLESSLIESEKRYKVATDLSSNGIWEWDAITNEVYYSASYYRLLGYSPGEFEESLVSWRSHIYPEDYNRVMNYLDEYFENRYVTGEIEYRLRTKSGDWKWILTRSRTTEFDASGKPAKLIGVHIDISDSKRREENILRKRDWLSRIINSFAIPAFVIDSDHRITHWNRAIELLTDQKESEMIGTQKQWHPFYQSARPILADMIIEKSPEKDIEKRYPGKYRKSKAVPGTYEVEDYFPSIGDSGKWLHFTSSVITDRHGNPTGAIETIQDITERKIAEETIRSNERKYRMIFDYSPIAIVLINSKSRIVDVNPRVQEWLGYNPVEIIGKRIDAIPFMEAESRQIASEMFFRRMSGENIEPYELEFTARDGSTKTGRMISAPISLDSGEIMHDIVMISDVTHQKLQETALRESENLFRNLAQTAASAIFIIQGDRFVYFNPATEYISGLSAGQLARKRIWHTIHADSRREVMDKFYKRILGARSTSKYEVKVQNKMRGPRWVELNVSVIEYKGKIAYLGTAYDITERKHAEKALAESEEKFRSLTEQLPVGVYRTTINGRILHANPALARILGFDNVEEVLNRNAGEFYVNIQDRMDELDQWMHSTDVVYMELQLRQNSGGTIWVRDHGRAIHDDNRNIIYFDGVLENITEQKEAREKIKNLNIELEERVRQRTSELEKAMAELEDENKVRRRTEKELTRAKEELFMALEKEKEVNKLKSRFISMISHEYRTPLTVIMTSTYVIDQLYEGEESEAFNNYLVKIRASVQTMTDLLENVLTIGKEEEDNANFNPTQVDIVELCKNVLNEIEVLDNKNHEFICSTEKPDNLIIETDERHLRQIMSNLLSNAVKYSPDNSTIALGIEHDEKYITFKVKDNGIGIPTEDLKHIYEPFHRGENIGVQSGTGLGLAIVRRCVDILDGEITVDSRIGQGTEFAVRLRKIY